jgi:hypothetical protein
VAISRTAVQIGPGDVEIIQNSTWVSLAICSEGVTYVVVRVDAREEIRNIQGGKVRNCSPILLVQYLMYERDRDRAFSNSRSINVRTPLTTAIRLPKTVSNCNLNITFVIDTCHGSGGHPDLRPIHNRRLLPAIVQLFAPINVQPLFKLTVGVWNISS